MASKKRRSSGPTQSESDRLAAGRVQLKVRVSAAARTQLDSLTEASGRDLSGQVEHLIGEAWRKQTR